MRKVLKKQHIQNLYIDGGKYWNPMKSILATIRILINIEMYVHYKVEYDQ